MLVEFCLPVFNEEKIIAANAQRLYAYCGRQHFDFVWKIVLLNNGSNDKTALICHSLAKTDPQKIIFENFSKPGKGGAIKNYFLKSHADVLAYLDIDLAVSLKNIDGLINSVTAGDCDLAIGSRLLTGSSVERSFFRTISSVIYNFFSRLTFGHDFKDLQCGFKAMNRRLARKVLPRVKNSCWFFDTELIVLANYYKFRVKEIPIDWSENRYDQRKSKVKPWLDGLGLIINLIKLKIRLLYEKK